MSPINFFDYQRKAAKYVIGDLVDYHRSLLVMATGTGKTYTALNILDHFLKDNPCNRVLILAHRQEILDQWSQCVTEVYSENAQTQPVHTITSDAHQFLICSFQFAWTNIKQGAFPLDYFNYVIVDEAHHSQATTFKQVLETLHFDWILGLTATPNRLDGANIRTIFGPESFTYDLATAIADGSLTPATIKIRSCQITEGMLEQIRTETKQQYISRTDLERRIFVRSKISEECRMIQEESGDEQALIFCSSITQAQEVDSYLPNTQILTYKKTSNANHQALEQFRSGEIQFLISIDKLIEGVDLPFVQYGFSLRSTASPTIIWQQIGRILRRYPGKKKAVFVDFVGNFQKIQELKGLEEQIKEKHPQSENASSCDDAPVQHVDSFIDFIWGNEVHELYDLLQGTFHTQEKYATLPEMQEAWKNLVHQYEVENTVYSYNRNRYKDPSLPCWSSIQKWFHLTSWNEFKPDLGDQKYNTLPEIYEAWKKLVVEYDLRDNQRSYRRHYRLDPKLPSFNTIERTFEVSWNQFTGKGRKPEQYTCLSEMQKAWQNVVQNYGVENTFDSYNRNRYKDPHLPCWNSIQKWFQISWKEFLGKKNPRKGSQKYTSLEDIQEAWKDLIQRFGLKNTCQAYKNAYLYDPKLPSWDYIEKHFGISWNQFKSQVNQGHYSSLKELQEVWKQLVEEYNLSNTLKEYKKKSLSNPCLPSWFIVKTRFHITSWREFKPQVNGEMYMDLHTIRQAWKNLVIMYNLKNTSRSYQDNRHLDPQLPSWNTIRTWFDISWETFKLDL